VQPWFGVADGQEAYRSLILLLFRKKSSFRCYKREIQGKPLRHLSEQGGTAGLNSLNLQNTERCAPEARRELVAVECHARWGLNWSQLSTGVATDTSVGALDRLTERAELLSVIAVGAEGCGGRGRLLPGLGKGMCGRGRVRSPGMVNGGRNGSLS
jgi:hypothetical protein